MKSAKDIVKRPVAEGGIFLLVQVHVHSSRVAHAWTRESRKFLQEVLVVLRKVVQEGREKCIRGTSQKLCREHSLLLVVRLWHLLLAQYVHQVFVAKQNSLQHSVSESCPFKSR